MNGYLKDMGLFFAHGVNFFSHYCTVRKCEVAVEYPFKPELNTISKSLSSKRK